MSNFRNMNKKIKKSRKFKTYNKNKKSSIQVSMSWLFMIIIGTFFIILGYNVISKYKMIEEQKSDIKLKYTLRTIFNNIGRTAGIEENKLNRINPNSENMFQHMKIEVECYDGMPLLLRDGLVFTKNNEFIKNYPIFMTNLEQGKSGANYIAVESFKMPFKITNLLALISKKNFIIFDKNSKISEKLVSSFKKGSYSELNYIVKDFTLLDETFVSEINSRNFNSVIFVSDPGINFGDSSNPLTLKKFNSETYRLEVNMSDKKFGKLKYIDKDSNEFKFNYIDFDESLTLVRMGVFSRPSTYNCSYNLIINSIPPIYSFYINKTNYLENLTGTKKLCSSTLSNIEEKITYQQISKSLNTTKNIILSERFNDLINVTKALTYTDYLEKEEVERYSCVYIY